MIQNAFYSLKVEKISIMKNIWKVISDKGCGYICPAELCCKSNYSFQHAMISPMLNRKQRISKQTKHTNK